MTRLSTVERSYAALDSYQDTGRVVMTGPNAEQSACVFRTWFSRPDLRFELRFLPELDWHVVELTASVLKTSGRLFQRGAPTSLDLAIASLTGVSWGVAHIVPYFLLPQMISGRVTWDAGRKSARVSGDAIEMSDDGWRWSVTVHPTHQLISRVETTLPGGAAIVIEYESIQARS